MICLDPLRHSHCGSMDGCCEWTTGWMGGQPAASEPQRSASASAGRPCENPCARECRCLSQAGMGSAMEKHRTCMRTERAATSLEATDVAHVEKSRAWQPIIHNFACFELILSHVDNPKNIKLCNSQIYDFNHALIEPLNHSLISWTTGLPYDTTGHKLKYLLHYSFQTCFQLMQHNT